MFNEDLGVEVQEVAEPADTGEEVQEVAEPAIDDSADSGKTAQDARFAEMRRANEALETELAELKETIAAQEARQNALQRLTGRNDADVNAIAEQMGLEPEDILATITAEQNSLQKEREIERLRAELNDVKAEKQVQETIAELQKLDPKLKAIDDLGESADMFVEYVAKGLSVESAYYAVKAKEINTKVTPPPEIGTVNTTPQEKNFFTEAEVDAMTPEQQRKYADVIIASMTQW